MHVGLMEGDFHRHPNSGHHLAIVGRSTAPPTSM